ncbi:MAG: UDP-N-acetylglucosamine diphosphorylase/glucosamine-1-phosphate N-acetyltransferase [Clostridiales bacterium GWC2_40_7]|nr:MAG: UDP-N-acetylglucosamine diphosphorylase/glucosamine-1-phosphate N-acetyltransferase [Clostridiales bacterium GWC2_40_7]
MENITALILAAGEDKRMKSKKSRLTHRICGKAMIEWVFCAVTGAGIGNTVVVTGRQAEQVMDCMKDRVKYVMQQDQLGTGHAVMQAEQYFNQYDGVVFVLYGDTPLVTQDTLLKAVEEHIRQKNTVTVVTAEVGDPTGYGRIKRDGSGNILGIVEHRDATEAEREINEINSGMYLFSSRELFNELKSINNKNDKREFCLTDVLAVMIEKGLKVGVSKMENPEEVLGVNDRVQLHQATEILRQKILKRHMLAGVTIMNPNCTYMDEDVEIGSDTVIYPGTILEGATRIGEGCVLGPDTRLVNTVVGNNSTITNSVVTDSTIGNDAAIGPFAYIRPESRIGDKVKIGDFVEIKKSVIGNRTKIPHLAYIGDSEVGENTNIACGVITVNYNGRTKSKTIIGNNAFVGCNVNLIAPVRVSDNAYIAAGSTITEDVPENALSIARSRQVNKEDWVIKKGMQRK